MALPVSSNWRTPTVVLLCGGLVISIGMGIRHGFGLFLQPMTTDLGWGRESFWLGGFAYDRTGSYDVVWLIAIALGVVAALVNLPIDDREIPRAPRPLTA